MLLIEDERGLADLLHNALIRVGWEAEVATTGLDAVERARLFRPDAVVLDIGLPDIDGFEVLARMRADDPTVAVLFLTARDSSEDRLAAIDAGGDDYVTKPFGVDNILARLSVILRRGGMTHGTTMGGITLGDLYVNDVTREVRRGGTPIELTSVEFDLLLYLIEGAPQARSTTEILECVWHYDFGANSHVVELYIAYLRNKIDRNRAPMIHAVAPSGYAIAAAAGSAGGAGRLDRGLRTS